MANKKGLLIVELSGLVSKYGFMNVISALEQLASDNADINSNPLWEKIRENLEESLLEFEEHTIKTLDSNMLN